MIACFVSDHPAHSRTSAINIIIFLNNPMAEDPFKSLVKDPKLYITPEKMKTKDILAFESVDMRKAQQTLKNFKGSLIYIGRDGFMA